MPERTLKLQRTHFHCTPPEKNPLAETPCAIADCYPTLRGYSNRQVDPESPQLEELERRLEESLNSRSGRSFTVKICSNGLHRYIMLHLHCMFDACNLKIFRVHMSAGSHKIISFIT